MSYLSIVISAAVMAGAAFMGGNGERGMRADATNTGEVRRDEARVNGATEAQMNANTNATTNADDDSALNVDLDADTNAKVNAEGNLNVDLGI